MTSLEARKLDDEQLLASAAGSARGARGRRPRAAGRLRGARAAAARLGAERARGARARPTSTGSTGSCIPGGESTTMTLGIEREGLAEPLRALAARGHARARHVRRADHARPRPPRPHGHARARATRSAARSAASRPTSSSPGSRASRVRAVFIRAPWIAEHGARRRGARRGRRPSGRRARGRRARVAFHPELARRRRACTSCSWRSGSPTRAARSDHEAVAHRVLGHDVRLDELQEVVGAAGLRAGARTAGCRRTAGGRPSRR